ncbi:MAG: ABC transporter permease, partial [Firmicutes bacterium]|nr:ABC transporter permease [Bacillota bacterium]
MLKKSTFREIRNSLGRYLAILAIVALGVGFFAGLKVTQDAMVATTGNYLEEQNFFDYRVLSTLGLEKEDVETLASVDGVKSAEGSVSTDAL